jgi:hypothetical protein
MKKPTFEEFHARWAVPQPAVRHTHIIVGRDPGDEQPEANFQDWIVNLMSADFSRLPVPEGYVVERVDIVTQDDSRSVVISQHVVLEHFAVDAVLKV